MGMRIIAKLLNGCQLFRQNRAQNLSRKNKPGTFGERESSEGNLRFFGEGSAVTTMENWKEISKL